MKEEDKNNLLISERKSNRSNSSNAEEKKHS